METAKHIKLWLLAIAARFCFSPRSVIFVPLVDHSTAAHVKFQPQDH